MKAVVAMARNRVIGNGGQIPWHLPEDFKWFKELTTGGIVLMGRKTFASLPKPLPNRTNVVFTRGPKQLAKYPPFQEKCGSVPVVGFWSLRLKRLGFQLGFERIAAREVWLVRSISRFLAAVDKYQPKREIFVIGGSQIYERMLPRCTDLYLSLVYRDPEGDAFFPRFEDRFELAGVLRQTPDFEVRHYTNRELK